MSKRLKIAVQSNGRLTKPSLEFLSSLGLKFSPNGRRLAISCDNSNLDILFLRSSDIPEYVRSGIIDFGIVGENTVYEKKFNVNIIKKLGFASCFLTIAVPKDSNIKQISDLNGERITTSYPNLLKVFLKKNNVNASIIEIRGSVEVTPALGLTDAICDITQSGNTLKENNLIPLITVMESEAVLISNPNNIEQWKY